VGRSSRARRRWTLWAAAAAVSLVALALPGAGRADPADQIVFQGTATNGWWSQDTIIYFTGAATQYQLTSPTGTTFAGGEYIDNDPLHGPIAVSQLGAPNEGTWTISWWPEADPGAAQSTTFSIDFTPPTPGSFICDAPFGGWCHDGFVLAGVTDNVSRVDHTEVRFDSATNPQASWLTIDPTIPFVIQGQHTVEWRTFDRAGNVSATQSAAFQMDTLPPVVTGSLAGLLGNNGWYLGPVTVTETASDPQPGSGVASEGYSYLDTSGRYPGSGAYTGPFTIATEGVTNVGLGATDVAGNTGGLSGLLAVKIDTTPPTATVQLLGSPAFGNWYRDSAQFEINAADPVPNGIGEPSGVAHALFSFDGSNFTAVAPGSAQSGFPIDGKFALYYSAADNAGNVAPAQSVPVWIDGEPPQTSLAFAGTFNNPTGWYTTPVTVTASATDDGSGVASTQLCVDASCAPYAGPVTVGTGVHQIQATSTDNVGHVETVLSSGNSRTIKVDDQPPTGTLGVSGTQGANGWYVSPVDLTIENSADVGSGLTPDPFSYDISGSNQTSFDGAYHDTTQGFSTFDAQIHDVAGNVTRLSQPLQIDTQAPNVILDAAVLPGNAGWTRFLDIGGLSATDPAPGSGAGAPQFSLDGGPWEGQSYIDNNDDDIQVPDGTHTVDLRVSDNAGNTTQTSQTYEIDQTPPDVECTANTPSVWPTDGSLVPVSVDVSVADALSGPAGFSLEEVFSNVDGDPMATGEAAGWDVGTADTSGQLAALPGRTYWLVYDGQDVAGNDSDCSVQITVPGAPGPAIMTGNVTLPGGLAAQIDVRRDASGLIGGAGVSFQGAGFDVHSTGIEDAELLGSNGYVIGTLADGTEFILLLHDGGSTGPDSFRLILPEAGYDSGVLAPASGDIVVTQQQPDTTPPVLTLPGALTVDATSPKGAAVSYAATAKDNVDPHPSVVCAPASGSVFPIGTTTVSCTAKDASGNQSHGTFTVHVEGAGEQLADLLQEIVQKKLGSGFSLPTELRAAIEAFVPAHPKTSCLVLAVLRLDVLVQSGKKIPAADAAAIAADLARIETVLGC
jgi:hypothetical protein